MGVSTDKENVLWTSQINKWKNKQKTHFINRFSQILNIRIIFIDFQQKNKLTLNLEKIKYFKKLNFVTEIN